MSSFAQELLRKLGQLKEKGETEPLADLITSLREHAFTSQDLVNSGLSKAVYKLQKHEDSRVKEAAKSMVDKWKQMLTPGAEALPQKLGAAAKGESQPGRSTKAEAAGSSNAAGDGDPSLRVKLPAATNTIDPGAPDANIRSSALAKLTEIFTNVVVHCADFGLSQDEVEGVDPVSLAAEMETCMRDKLGSGTGTNYKNKLRSLLFNLKDRKNPELVTRVICGSLMPEKLVTMDPKDMASSETKKWREQVAEYKKMELMDKLTYQRYAYKDRELPDGLFECPKCRSKKTEYSEKQTRSADEPTTKFCHCTACDYRWKFC